MGKNYLIDTNSLIDAQMQKLPGKGLAFLADVINENFTISFITYIEFLGYKNATQTTQDFIALATVIEINKAIIDICITLRKEHRIKLPDAIIAATALSQNLIIIANNEKDFEKYQRIEIYKSI